MTNKDHENEIAIKVDDVDKSFMIPDSRDSSLKALFANPTRIFSRHERRIEILKDISFEIKKGEFVGIIGRNGCGKSTLMKLISGIYLPNNGKITVNGDIVPFLELGVGFNPELSARENIYLNGTILGMTRKHLDARFDQILDFAEVQEFVDTPLKNYSSGMAVRLAFSIAIQTSADIYILDEVLSVGDANFQNKCANVFHDFKKEGKTIVLVSHSMDSIRRFCDKVIFLNEGRIVKIGKPDEVIHEYEKMILG